ncbi:MAG: non-heme iron oxygenase ferredoxin subunit [Anaerolineae bacterium]|mgnify:CR=1 FL=1|uniref:non-heme iron oxygenase ferredoxin subunit n=1 Tax=Candidatus Amarolinea dominans TaxID=3140696 RepID=UPI003136AE96|nr:non-heme iron oxygenase ferredoxin subunit [Anaerolineae bacterium]
MAKFVKVAARADIPVGGKKLVEIDGVAVAVFNVNGSFYAIEDVCTHDGGNLVAGDLFGNEIECPRHGARFDVRSGAATKMPAFAPLPTYAVKVEQDNVLVETLD